MITATIRATNNPQITNNIKTKVAERVKSVKFINDWQLFFEQTIIAR